ncbi:MAG: protein kinase [Planctomycetales bacterium]|nr:protein kinase [Planctomycetales bacterium]
MILCPTHETLQQVLTDSLPDADRGAVEDHLAECAKCQMSLEQLAVGDGNFSMGHHSRMPAPAHAEFDAGLVHRIERELRTSASVVSATANVSTEFDFRRLVGTGGLGEVYAYHDAQLQREVALKVLKADHQHSSARRQRFVREYSITSGLDHPGVVPVFGIGRISDGRDFYLMRLVRGRALSEHIRELHAGRPKLSRDNASFRELLHSVMTVCDTIQFAHNRQVIHRDLKPANVMVDEDGATLVLDWGLAKRLSDDDLPGDEASESDLTHDGHRLGSPPYMSPEQAAGRTVAINQLTDVYGIGAILFDVLTGKPPHQRQPTHRAGQPDDAQREMLQRIASVPASEPAAIKTGIPRELNSICAKAMAFDPGDRYATAAELKQDLERWLIGQRVAAHRYSVAGRVSNWMRRHPGVSVTTTTAALVIVSTVSVALARVNHFRGIADRRADESERSERLLGESIAAYGVLGGEIQARLANRVGTRDLGIELTNMVISGLERLPDQGNSPTARNHYLVRAQLNLGRMNRRTGGQTEPALEAADRVLEAAEANLRINPLDLDARLDLIDCHRELTEVHHQSGNIKEARTSAELAVKLVDTLKADHPLDRKIRLTASLVHSKLGDILLVQEGIAVALGPYVAARELAEQLQREQPEDRDVLRHWMLCLERLADLDRKGGKLESAMKTYERSLAVAERLASPNDARSQRDVVTSRHILADLAQQLLKYDVARQHLDVALKISTALVAKDPMHLEYRGDLADTYHRLGNWCRQQKQFAEALDFFTKDLDETRKLVADDPNNVVHKRSLTVTLRSLANLHRSQNELKPALACAQEALKIVLEIQKLPGAESQPLVRDHATALQILGTLHEQQGSTDDLNVARKHLEQAHDLFSDLVIANPQSTDAVLDLMVACQDLGRVAGAMEDVGESWRYRREHRQQAERLVELNPSNPEFKNTLVASLATTGLFLMELANPDAAESEFQSALKVLTQLHEAAEKNGVSPFESKLERLKSYLPKCQQLRLILSQTETTISQQAAEGRVKEALSGIDELGQLSPMSAEIHYRVAHCYALVIAARKKDGAKPANATVDPIQLAKHAVAALQTSRQLGFTQFERLRDDEVWQVLNGDPDFNDFRASLNEP